MSGKDEDEWVAVLSHYDLGALRGIEAGGGTAAPKVWVQAERGRYLLRQRRPASSIPDVVRFDHGVIQALAAAGLPCVPPERTRSGETWVQRGDAAYELFRYVPDLERFRQGNLAQISAAGETLARFHRTTRDLQPPGAKPWPPEHEIGAMYRTLAETLPGAPGTPIMRAAGAEMLASAERLRRRFAEIDVPSLPHVIIHGDYTPANILFRGDAVGGIFDMDWVSRQARLIDIGEALIFFAFRRASDIAPDRIASLVQTWEPDERGARAFLTAYQSLWPLGADESQILPLYMWQTWLGVRIRAMRKVAPAQQLALLTTGALRPLRWLEQEAPSAMADLIAQTTGDISPI